MIYINEKVDSLRDLKAEKTVSSWLLSAPILIHGAINEVEIKHHFNKHIYNAPSSNSIHKPVSIEIGVDEVGRGPLYGSVVIAAVILPTVYSGLIEDSLLKDTALTVLTDSKKLTETKREQLLPLIKRHSLAYVTVEVPASIVDDVNILQATLIGMRLACEHLMINMVSILDQNQISCYTFSKYRIATQDIIACQYSLLTKDFLYKLPIGINNVEFKLLIDGNKIPQLDWQNLANHRLGKGFGEHINAEAWIKGDGRHTAIAAASVLAKVTRDRQLIQDGLQNPGYGLESHKGYPTKAHIKAIQTLGLLKLHRRSFKPVMQALEKWSNR